MIREKFSTHSTIEKFGIGLKCNISDNFHPFNYYKKMSIKYELHSDNGFEVSIVNDIFKKKTDKTPMPLSERFPFNSNL